MKITVDIDCTPEEARAFLGLPDVRPLQESLLRDVEARMKESMAAMRPEEMMKLWLPANVEGFERMGEAFMRMAGMKRD